MESEKWAIKDHALPITMQKKNTTPHMQLEPGLPGGQSILESHLTNNHTNYSYVSHTNLNYG